MGVVHEHIGEYLGRIEERASEEVKPEHIHESRREAGDENLRQPDDEVDEDEVFCHGRDGAPPAARRWAVVHCIRFWVGYWFRVQI